MEDILDEKYFRLTLLPVNQKFEQIWKLYKLQQSVYWTSEEIDFSSDRNDFDTLTKEEQHILKMILAFFSASDGIVNVNLRENFTKLIKPIEILVAYDFQCMMENIHAEVYSIMLDNLITDNDEKEYLINDLKILIVLKK
jgi:ribonucleotide reductase beta subunit family protein with ferritin-like domain